MHLIGAYTGTIVGSAPNRDRMHQFAGFLGRRPDFQLDFAPGNSFAAMADPSIPQGWRKFGTTRMVITMPLIPASNATLAHAADGVYNAVYASLMAKYQEAGFQDGIIRLGHEFNGTWYSWRANEGREAAFVGAWRNAVKEIRKSPNGGGSGVGFLFDWCPTRGAPAGVELEACYPGDEFVDVIGLDVYNQSWVPGDTDPLVRWDDIRNGKYGLEWHREFARRRGKPMSYPEWGTGLRIKDGVPESPQHAGGDDPIFVRNMAAWIKSNPVLYHAYWDFAADLDCRISDYRFPNAAKAYRAAFRD